MNKMQKQVEEFNRAMHQTVGECVATNDETLRANLIEEEARELCEAIRNGQLVGAVDGMCDLLYVVFGTAVAFGVDLEPFFDEIHRTNMLKTTGPVREDGKRLKPEGWQPPKIAEMLAIIFDIHPDKQKETFDALAPNT